MSGGINMLDLPGGAGCNSMPNSDAYDHVLWAIANAQFACAWDTGKATVLQQPVKDTNFVGRAAFKLAPTHTAFAELMASNVETRKSFSNNQISTSTSSTSPVFNVLYPSTGSSYNRVFNAIAAVFPTIEENRGQGIAFRWRCMECGRRELETEAKADRILVGLEGSFNVWDYKAALARARSDVVSTIAGGYYFDDQFFPLLRNGILNPFLLPGETQTQAALDALAAASATGVKLYGGEFTASTFDASIAGPVWKLPAGELMVAAGVDLRREEYKFQGDERDLANQRGIFNVPFDNVNALSGVDRDIKAVYGEVLIPILRDLEVTAAVRRDDYTGFGATTNPKVTVRYQPTQRVVLRGGYNTGFRVPTFNQLFNGITESQFTGATLVDFSRCPAGVVSTTPGCESIRPVIVTGGRPNLGPEESEQWNVGVVFAILNNLSVSVDYWDIKREGTIQLLDLTTLSRNYALFPDRFLRDASGNITHIDNRWVNAGETVTKGVDIGVRWNGRVGPGGLSFSLDGTYLDEKKSRIIESAPFGPSEVGVFTRSGDLGLVWKHNATLTYTQGPWAGSLTQIYRSGYDDFVLPGVANGSVRPPDWDPKVDDYWVHNVAVSYSGFKGFTIVGGIKNIFGEDPPFSVAYDSNTGAGSSWEPRVADPRGRAYTLSVTYRF
jgi:iron complex outermembrane receptor protein